MRLVTGNAASDQGIKILGRRLLPNQAMGLVVSLGLLKKLFDKNRGICRTLGFKGHLGPCWAGWAG